MSNARSGNQMALRDAVTNRPAQGGGQAANTISNLLSQESVKRRFEEILGSKAPGFISSVINTVNGNTNLRECDPRTILSAAAVAASLDLPIDPNLGFAYIIPYKHKGVPKAQFQIGFKGFVQLAMRSGQYQTINAAEVYEGEIIRLNRLTGDVEFDPDSKTSDKIVGYAAYFRLLNGFEKYLYMSVEEIDGHARKYSKSYNRPSGLWKQDFHAMALKTVLKRLLSRYGILSIQMQTATSADQAVVRDAETGEGFDYDYIDTDGGVSEDAVPTIDADFSADEIDVALDGEASA